MKQNEQALIGAIIREQRVPEGFSETLFHQASGNHRKIARAILDGDTDMLSLSDRFPEIPPHYFAECVNKAHDLMNAEAGVKICRRERLRDKINEIAEKAKQSDKPPEEVAAELAIDALGLTEDRPKEKTDVTSILKEIDQDQSDYVTAYTQGRRTIGIPTGYKLIDNNISGLRPNHLIVLSAYTNVGKTTFALNIARNILNQGKRVVILSLEMSRKDLLSKLIALEGDMPISSIMESAIDNRYEIYKETTHQVKNWDLSIYEEIHGLSDIILVMKAEEERRHVDLFILDYIQNIVEEGKEYEAITKAVRELQATTAKLKSTCLAVSQIANDDRKAAALSINGKGSGAIRAASDLFIFLKYKDDEDDEILRKLKNDEPMPMLAIINKNRHGKLSAQELTRNPFSGQMYEV